MEVPRVEKWNYRGWRNGIILAHARCSSTFDGVSLVMAAVRREPRHLVIAWAEIGGEVPPAERETTPPPAPTKPAPIPTQPAPTPEKASTPTPAPGPETSTEGSGGKPQKAAATAPQNAPQKAAATAPQKAAAASGGKREHSSAGC